MYEQLFAFAGLATPFWMLMLLLPAWRVTKFLVGTAIFPIFLAILYTVGFFAIIGESGFGFIQDFSSSSGVIRLLSNPNFALLVWIHVLCFDQFVGHYVYRDNMEHRYVPLPVQSVLLFMCLMFGPLGFLLYLILKTLNKRARSRTKVV